MFISIISNEYVSILIHSIIYDAYKDVKYFSLSIVTTLPPVSTTDVTRKIELEATVSTTTDIAVTTTSETVATTSTTTEMAVTSISDTVTIRSKFGTTNTEESSAMPSSK